MSDRIHINYEKVTRPQITDQVDEEKLMIGVYIDGGGIDNRCIGVMDAIIHEIDEPLWRELESVMRRCAAAIVGDAFHCNTTVVPTGKKVLT